MRIKDLRQLLSLSENGFRFYEDMGVITPLRNESNGYRVMFLSDGLRLFNAFNLTRFGISVKQANEILNGSIGDGISAFEKVSEDISHKLEVLLERKDHLDYLTSALREYEADPHRCAVTEKASLCFLPVHYQNMSLDPDSYEDGPLWWKVSPLVDAGLLVTIGAGHEGTNGAHGPVTSEQTVRQWNLPTKHARLFCSPGQKCLRFYTKYPAGQLPGSADYAHAFVYLASHGLKMKGDAVLHRMLRHVTEDGVAKRVDEAFMPIIDVGEESLD